MSESPVSEGICVTKAGTPCGSPHLPSTFTSPTSLFPADVLRTLTTTQPENLKCFDCSSPDVGWASVSNGVFICLACAGIHRSLGVGVSVVRSVYMDAWTELQVQMMVQGGNKQFKSFLESLDIHQPPIEILYTSKAATFYRAKLKRQAESVAAGSSVQITIAESLELSRHVRNDPLPTSSASSAGLMNRRAARLRYAVAFPSGPMGMTIIKDADSLRPVVSKVSPGSVADNGGVRVGDFLDGVAEKFIPDFDILMHMIPLMPRPLFLHFSRERGPVIGNDADDRDSSSMHTHNSSSLLSSDASGNGLLSVEKRWSRSNRGVPQLSAAGTKLMSITLLRDDGGSFPSDQGEEDPSVKDGFPPVPSVQRHISAPSLALSLDASVLGLNSFQTMKQSPHKTRVTYGSSTSTLGDLDDKDYHSDPESLASAYPRRTPSADKRADHIGSSRQNSHDRDCRSPLLSRRLRSCSSDDCKDFAEGDAFVTSQSTTPRGKRHSSFLSRRSEEGLPSIVHDPSVSSGPAAASIDTEENTIVSISNAEVSIAPNEYDENREYTLVLKRGMEVRVRCDDSSWRVGLVHDQHKDGSFLITYQNNDTESHVEANRIALSTRAFQQAIELSLGSNSPGAQSYSSSQYKFANILRPVSVSDSDVFEVHFDSAPMGLTITKTEDGRAYISAIKEGGKASSTAMKVGDLVLGINGIKIDSYEVLMKLFSSITYPVEMSMLRASKEENRARSRSDDLFFLHEVHHVLEMFSKDLRKANGNLGRSEMERSIWGESSPVGARRDMHLEDIHVYPSNASESDSVSVSHFEEEYAVGYSAAGDIEESESSKFSNLIDLVADLDARANFRSEGPSQEIKRQSYDFGEKNCRDVIFEKDGEIGITLKQTNKSFGNKIASSEVIRVRPGTPAAAQGVVVGAVILGINGEPYVSHLHTADLLKNAPRPIVVRFMFPKT